MFEDSLIESGGRLRSKRGKATTISFALQGVLLGILVLMPFVFTEALPKQQLMTFLVAPPPPPPPPPPPAAAPVVKVRAIQTEIINNQLRTPTAIPKKVVEIKDEPDAPTVNMGGVPGGVPGGVAGGSMGGVLGGIIGAANVAVPHVAAPQRVRVSAGVTAGLVLRKVQPTYPSLAKSARIQGNVVLQAQISKEGNIENLQVVSGHPMLINAAIDAVKQWKYRPYILNGEPVAVDTQVTVIFTLSGS
jgi:protein TonB